MSRHPYVVDVFGELVCRPLLFTIQCCEAELMDMISIEGGPLTVDHRIMTVDSHRPVIVRGRLRRRVFGSSLDASRNGWPVLPNVRDRIVTAYSDLAHETREQAMTVEEKYL